MNFALDNIQTLLAAIAVLFIGAFLTKNIRFFETYDIPMPVVGGLAFAVLISAAHTATETTFTFATDLKAPLMLAFFTTVGMSADFRMLIVGGVKLLLFLVLAATFVLLQDAIGVAMATAMDLHPLIGLIGGSITLTGGHGTGAAYAERFSNVENIQGVMELAMACATFGLVIGGFLGGPIGHALISRFKLSADHSHKRDHQTTQLGEAEEITALSLLETLGIVVFCMVGGHFVSGWTSGLPFTLPVFIWSLFIGVVLMNALNGSRIYKINQATTNLIGTISLYLFLAMALMSLRLWELVDLAGPIAVIIVSQTVAMAAFAYYVTFRVMGRDYDAAIMAGGHCGFGMGATPTAVANMQALVATHGPSPQAFLIIPMVGAFFIDIMNAIVIQLYLSLPLFGF